MQTNCAQDQLLKKNIDKHSEKNDAAKVLESTLYDKKQNEKDIIQCDILKAFEKDSKEHYVVNNDCGLNNTSQKCNRCKYITHSMGLLRIHEKETHKVYHNFEKIVDAFKFDNIKYFEVLSAMYERDELNKNSCEECNFKTHSAGILRLHVSNTH